MRKLFEPGHHSAGRPRGARNRVSKVLIETYREAFEKWGPRCLDVLAKTDPATFLRLGYGSLIPRDLNIEVSTITDYTDDELDEALQRLKQVEQRPQLELTAEPEKVLVNGRH